VKNGVVHKLYFCIKTKGIGMKKDKLYTINKWNRRLLAGGGEVPSSSDNNYSTGGGTEGYLTHYINNLNNGYSYNGYVNKSGQSYIPNVNTPQTIVSRNYANNALATIQSTTDSSNEFTSQITNGGIKGGNAISGVDYTQVEQGGGADGSEALDTLAKAIDTGVDLGSKALPGTANSTASASSGATPKWLTDAANRALASDGLNAGLNSGANAIGDSFLLNMANSPYASLATRQAALDSISKGFKTSTDSMIANMGKTGAEGKLGSDLLGGATAMGGKSFMQRLKGAFGADKLSSLESAGIGIGANIVGGIGKSLLSDGLSTPTGNNIATIGSGIGTAVGTVNPIIGGAVTLASNLIGGVVNAGWGHKVYGTGEAKNYLNNMSGFKVGGSNDNVE